MSLPIDAILVPQGAEYFAVCRGLKYARRNQTEVISVPIGVNDIAQNLDRKLFWQQKPQTVLMMGLCGSLYSQYRIGDRILYQSCSLEEASLATDKLLTDRIGQKLFPSVTLANSITSDRPICQVKEKLLLAKKYSSSVVDMEGFAYLQKLQQRDVAVAMLRVVSDDLTGNLPDISQAIDRNGNLNAFNLAIAMLRQPLASARLIKGSLVGLKALQQTTTELFR